MNRASDRLGAPETEELISTFNATVRTMNTNYIGVARLLDRTRLALYITRSVIIDALEGNLDASTRDVVKSILYNLDHQIADLDLSLPAEDYDERRRARLDRRPRRARRSAPTIRAESDAEPNGEGD